jgi:hypothetical protein
MTKGRPGLDHYKALTVLLAVEGPSLGGSPRAMLEAMVGKVRENLAKPLTKANCDQALDEYEWMEVLRVDGSWSGPIRLRLAEMSECAVLRQALRGMPPGSLGARSWSTTRRCQRGEQVLCRGALPGGPSGAPLGDEQPAARGCRHLFGPRQGLWGFLFGRGGW